MTDASSRVRDVTVISWDEMKVHVLDRLAGCAAHIYADVPAIDCVFTCEKRAHHVCCIEQFSAFALGQVKPILNVSPRDDERVARRNWKRV